MDTIAIRNKIFNDIKKEFIKKENGLPFLAQYQSKSFVVSIIDLELKIDTILTPPFLIKMERSKIKNAKKFLMDAWEAFAF